MREDEPLVAEGRDVRDELVSWADERVASLARGRTVDVGCGEGRFLREGWTGVDVDAARLRFARLRSPRVVRADARALPFAADTFVTALAFRMLNATGAIDAVLLEIRRVLRRGGILLVLTVAAATGSQLRLVDDAARDRRGQGDRLDEENGEARLERFFAVTRTERFSRTFRFDDAGAALDHYARLYLHRGAPDPAETLARFERARERMQALTPPIEDERRATLFIARKA